MSFTIKREGYAYVEPNFLSAPRTGQVRADLPAAEGIDLLMNGMFVKRDTVNEEVNFTGAGAWWLVFNEEKLYDERKQMHRDFAMEPSQFYDGKMVPRILLPILGDTFTTNAFNLNASGESEALNVGDYVIPDTQTGLLKKVASGTSFLRIVKHYTMPDGQPGVKLEVVANQ